ncbi:uncharacterized protein LOC124679446 [Lolium rigidum]|uniref:uncharacterized protein LOC124679446 n=1 Tax=Lolium rigidum TaxID=89674 RepID=UPI001F5DCDC7|nr:uncharacterized protein LOC124679446 [Lolium rigidum]XP_047071158.1 uncharacterized protein LOC124679446 [Lolium rigidum]
MAEGPMDFWINWASQIGVLVSLGCQITLHLLANLRRRSSSIGLRFPLWLAYQLSDLTATYAAGQLLYSSSTPQDHQLIAYWAPFLLLHLGGPDNITAYALEDNKLWTRHLLSLVLQVLGAGYVLYKHITGSGLFLMLAAILIFLVGFAKYAERTCALWLANFSSLQSSLKVLARNQHHQHFYIEHQDWYCNDLEDELVLQRAHSLFHICKRGIVDSVIEVDSDSPATEVDSEEKKIIGDLRGDIKFMWSVMEMELSLLYDILYTKASVAHSWVGYCIRVISPLAIAASLVLFQLSIKDGYSRLDIDITYTLLGSALVLETKSLVGALGSSWALALLCATRWDWLRHSALCSGRWHRLRSLLISLRRSWPGKIMTGTSRKWSGTMGQHNMLRFRAGQVDPMSRRLGNLFKMLGCGDWWNRRYYSCSIVVPKKVMERAQALSEWVSRRDVNTMGLLRDMWGESLDDEERYPGLFKKLKEYHGVDFHESIIIWHIATDLILAAWEEKEKRADLEEMDRVEIIRALSNYLMFLLVNRPYMLPGLPQNWLYQQTCNNLDGICRKNQLASSPGDSFCTVLKKFFRRHRHWDLKPSMLEKELADLVLNLKDYGRPGSKNPRLIYAQMIAKIVIEAKVHEVSLLLVLWTDFLAYAANRCSRESHARKLSSGGELTTIVWLILEHIRQSKE